MKRIFDDVYCWSVFNPTRQIDFNGHLWVRPGGNVLVDPVAIAASDLAQLEDLGGAAVLVITNRDHEREAAAMSRHTGAEVVAHAEDAAALEVKADRKVEDGDEIVPGLRAVHLRHGKSPGEIALHWPERGILLAGDLVVGAPVGRISLLMDEKLADPPRAALECRKLLALNFDTVLVGDGHSIVGGARRRLLECLEARADIDIHQVNAGDLSWTRHLGRDGYRWDSKEIDALVGARTLGYRLIRLPPGQSSYPYHLHHLGEELFIVLEGECSVRTPHGERPARSGDWLAFPPGPAGAHKFANRSGADCVLLALGSQLPHDVCEYPDSDKVNVFAQPGPHIFRRRDAVDYWDGE